MGYRQAMGLTWDGSVSGGIAQGPVDGALLAAARHRVNGRDEGRLSEVLMWAYRAHDQRPMVREGPKMQNCGIRNRVLCSGGGGAGQRCE